MKIAVAGTGYVGLSNSILLAQNNEVWAVDIVEEKVDLINHKKSPIVDKEIEEYLAEKPQMQRQHMKEQILLSFPLRPTMMRRRITLIHHP